MSSKHCCVPQCAEIEDSQRVLHWFPNPKKDIARFRMWVHAIGGEIIGMSNEDIYKLRRVCHAHFEEKYYCRNNKISNISVPTLLMPGSLSLSKFTYTHRVPFREVENLPSTSKGPSSLPEFTCKSQEPLTEIEIVSSQDAVTPVLVPAHDSCKTGHIGSNRGSNSTKKVIKHIKMSNTEHSLYQKLVAARIKLSKCRNRVQKQSWQLKVDRIFN